MRENKTAYCQAIRRLLTTGTVDDDSFTVCRDQVLIFQHFGMRPTVFASIRQSDRFRAGNFNLRIPSGWVIASGCLPGSAASGDTTSHVEERRLPLFRRNLQTARHLRRETHQDIRVNFGSTDGIFVGDFGHFTWFLRVPGAATLLTFFKTGLIHR